MVPMMIPIVRSIVSSIMRTASLPAAYAADRNHNYWRVSDRPRGEKSPTERAEKRSVTR